MKVSSDPPLALGWRITLTLVLLALPLAGEHLPLPGVDPTELERLGVARHLVSAFALGVTPLLSAALLVECAALLIPPWNRLRHDWPNGRARLNRAVELTALVLAGVQAFAVVMMLSTPAMGDSLNGGDWAAEVAGVSLVAGVGVLVFVTRAISRLGLVNGIVGLSIVFSLSRFFEQLVASPAPFAAVSVTLVVVATWVALKGSESGFAAATLTEFERKESDENEQLWVSVPASSVQPVAMAPALLALPLTFSLAEEFEVVAAPTLRLPISLGLGAALALLLSFLLQGPQSAARSLHHLRHGGSHTGELGLARRFRSTIRATLVPTLLFVSCLILANELVPAGLANASMFALLTALVLDVAVTVRARARDADLVCIREERRPHLVPFLVATLARHGIDARVLGLHQTSLTRFFAPYLSVELCVPAANAERARKVMHQVFEEPGARDESLEEVPNPLPPDVRGVTWAARSRRELLVALSVGALALVLLVPSPELPVASAPPVVSLEVSIIDDAAVPFAGLARGPLPAGVAVLEEYIALGQEDAARVHYARIVSQRGESLTEALTRLDPWLKELKRPPGTRLAFGDVKEAGNASTRGAATVWRSYVVQGPPLLGAEDVESAEVGSLDESAYVTLRLRPSATERFRQATLQNIGRRLAIIVDGKVRTAPLLHVEIPGPNLQITLGDSRPETALAEARELLAALTGQSSPALSR